MIGFKGFGIRRPPPSFSPPTHEAKGKGKEVDTPDPVTVPVSEQLKTFAKKADEKREAANADLETEFVLRTS